MQRKHEIVADGRRRAIKANRARIEAEVYARYARELQDAGLLRRVVLSVRIKIEIGRELQRVAPSDGLYAVDR